MAEYFVNGRVLRRPHGGVRRYAFEVSNRLDYRVLSPPSARYPWSARVWEQTVLAARARNGVLLSVAHSAPVAHPRSVVVIHDLFALTDNDVRPSFRALMLRQVPQIVKRAAAVATVSSEVADQIAERFDVDRMAIAIAPPGISDVFCVGDQRMSRDNLGLPLDRLTIGVLLDPTPRKCIERSIAAIDLIRSALPDAQIVAAGREFSPAFFRSDRASAPADFILDPSDAGLADIYRASDIVICSSNREGFGLAPVEAAACGAAVVSPAVPSITEFAPDAAVVIAPSAEAIFEAVIELANTDQRRLERQRSGQQAVADLKWEQTAATLDRLCRSVGE